MRDVLLYLNDRRADLPASLKGLFRLTQGRAALANLSARKGEFSWPLSLPATRSNGRIFGVNATHALGIDKFRTVDYAFELRCAGEIFLGTFRLSAISTTAYTGTLLGAGFAWAEQMGGRQLTDLQLPAINYDGSQLETILAQDCDATDLQFPLCSFGNFFHPPTLQTQPDGSQQETPLPAQALFSWPLSVDDYAPGVYYRNVLRQCFKDIGWTLTGRVLDEPQWREAVLTSAGADLSQAWPWGALLPAEAQQGGGTVSQFSYCGAGPGNGYTNTAVGFADPGDAGNIDGHEMAGEVAFLPVSVPVALSGGTRALNPAAATYLAPRAGLYSFESTCTISSGHQTVQETVVGFPTAAMRADFSKVLLCLFIRRGGESFDASCLRHGAPVDALQIPAYRNLATAFDNAGNFIPQSFTLAADDVYLEAGDSLQFCVLVRRQLLDTANNLAFLTRREFVLNFSAARFACTAAEGPLLLSPAKFLPPLACKEVIADFLQRTNCVIVADENRRTVRLLTQAELSAAAGEVLDLTGLIDSLDYSPTAGVGFGAVVFEAAENKDEPLPVGTDVVKIVVGPEPAEQTMQSLFAPVAFRTYTVAQGPYTNTRIALPTFASKEALTQNLDEVEWDASGEQPRLVRYTGPDPVLTVPFQRRRVPLARTAWDGALRWSGEAGAVNVYYPRTVQQLTKGHRAKGSINLTPALFRALTPGRQVTIGGAPYTVEAVTNYDLADEANQTPLELLRDL